MDAPFEADQERTLLDALQQVQQHIAEWLQSLPEKQREVVERRFGLAGRDASTLEQVGLDVGVTRERVRQIQVEALGKLRKILEKQGFSLDNLLLS